jgi:hypothetical protein
MGVPWRVAFALQSRGAADWKAAETISRVMADMYDAYDGEPIPDKVLAVLERLQEKYEHAKDGSWYLRSNIIWSKPNNMPESVTDRPTKAHEFIFLLTKQPNYFYDMDAIREEHESKPETVLRDRSREGYGNAFLTPLGAGKRSWYSDKGRNRRTVWEITTKPFGGAHFATFPPEIPEICIKAGTSEKGQCPQCGSAWERLEKSIGWQAACECDGRLVNTPYIDDSNGTKQRHDRKEFKPDSQFNSMEDVLTEPQIVFDPFGGSGTTAMVANQLGRIGVITDISYEYLELARERTGLLALDEWQNGKQAADTNLGDLPMFKPGS